MDNLLEANIKNHLLENTELYEGLGDLGDKVMMFEKLIPIYHNRVIADALLFTDNKGVISFEIKTQHDNLKRLSHQLDAYVLACTYNYVFCHDSKLEEVLALLKRKHYTHVGVITYDEFQGKVIAGVYQQPKPNPYFKLRALANIMWRGELYNILKVYYGKQDVLVEHTYNKINYRSDRQHLTGFPRVSANKAELLHLYAKTFDDFYGTKIICETFIHDNYDPEKQLLLYRPGLDTYHEGDIAYKIPYKKHKRGKQ